MSMGGPELLIVLAVVLLLFGAKKVPDLARSLGQARREFEDGTKDVPPPRVERPSEPV
ncbi:MAG TPA: twin-arginine translocase TatA/TatE family subunit [Acidimicrobiales bacterium]|nr:twin-arginine translocase TatA/TatE family subunit [Acidimicrobiales bacterium]